jgi:signal peptidase I
VLWPWGLHGLVETLEVLALALLMFIAVRSIAQNFVVDGGSMEPTFFNGEMLIVNKLAYKSFDISWLPWSDNHDWNPFGTPEPGDVVVFRFPQDQNRDFIKRVVAIPGQTVEIRGGKVYIDGTPRTERYLEQAPTYEYGPVTVPQGQLFVLGDNRNNSYDSHSWGLLDDSLLIGRAELRYWPLDRVGKVGHEGPQAATPEPGVTQSR